MSHDDFGKMAILGRMNMENRDWKNRSRTAEKKSQEQADEKAVMDFFRKKKSMFL